VNGLTSISRRNNLGCFLLENTVGMSSEATRFESLVAELFRLHGFDVQTSVRRENREADLIVTSQQGKTAVVEVKSYSSRTAPTAALTLAANQLLTLKYLFKTDSAILAVGVRISETEKGIVQGRHPGLLIYDVDVLAFLAATSPQLSLQLRNF
jgi:Holliday junction resolvase-like predicted endonuclease